MCSATPSQLPPTVRSRVPRSYVETVSAASRTRLQGPADALVARRAPRVAPSALGQPPELGQGGWGRGGALGGCPEAPDAVPALGRPVGDAQVGGEVAGPCELLDAQVAGVLHPERPVHLHVPVQAAPRSKCPVARAAVWRGRFLGGTGPVRSAPEVHRRRNVRFKVPRRMLWQRVPDQEHVGGRVGAPHAARLLPVPCNTSRPGQ